MLLDGQVALIVQFVVGKFSYSTSNAAALTLLAYVSAGFLIAWRFKPTTVPKHALATLTAALCLGHMLNLWLTLRYLHEFGLPPGVHLYHWVGQENSFTSLMHSHLGKTALSAAAEILGGAPMKYDTGRVFLPWVPVAVPWLIGASFIVGIVSAGLAIPAIASRHRDDPAALLLYLLASLTCLRAMLDGGPLAPVVPPAAVTLGWMSLPAEFRGRHAAAIGLAGASILIGYVAFWMFLSVETPIPSLGSFLFALASYAWLWLCCQERWIGLRAGLAGFLALSLVLDAGDNLLPYLYPQSSQCRAFHVDVDGVAHAVPCTGMSATEIYRRHGDDPRKPSTVLLSDAGTTGDNRLFGELHIVDARGEIRLPVGDGVWRQLDLRIADRQGHALYFMASANAGLPPVFVDGAGHALTRNNYYVYLHQLNRVLGAAGIAEYISIPATVGNGAP